MTESNDSATAPPTLAAALRPLLTAQARRLRGRFLGHGLAVVVLLPAAAVLLAFALDHWLHLPLPIRLLHSTAIATLLGWCLWRFVRYPLSRRFSEVDMAVLFERAFPELHQRFVSAVQLGELQGDDLRNQSREMIDRLLAETAQVAKALPAERMFDARPARRLQAGAAALLLGLGTGAALAPDTAWAFVLRQLGRDVRYPRATTLRLELPPAGTDLQRTDRDGVTELLLPAGADLHVAVLAEGTVPKDVFLDVGPVRDEGAPTHLAPTDARSVTMSPRPGGRFRHVFRRLTGSFRFHARGGDDERGDLEVIVHTVHPPQVATISAAVQPPAYTGAKPQMQPGGAIEGLVGSGVELSVATTLPVPQATMVFLESGVRLPLSPQDVQDDSGVASHFRAAFRLEGPDRYQIELVGKNGLHNPNPGTYPIAALQDYAPVGRWLLPDDEAPLLLPTALLCLRLEAHDDFGLAACDLIVDHGPNRSLQRSLLPAVDPQQPAEPVRTLLRTEILEVSSLLGAAAAKGEGLSLQIALRDNRAPAANTVELPRRIVQIVAPPQLAEAIGKAFRSLREEATQALEIVTDRRTRLLELLQTPPASAAELAQQLAGIEVGHSRVLAAAERLHHGLMRSFDVHLWNRLETSQHAAQVVELYRAFSERLTEPVATSPGFYRDLAARRAAGTLGAMETTLDPILVMIQLADRIATTDGPLAARRLDEAQVAHPGAELTSRLQEAATALESIQQTLQQLLLRLEEWNDYQDLVQEARALRDRQRDLQNRTEEAKGK